MYTYVDTDIHKKIRNVRIDVIAVNWISYFVALSTLFALTISVKMHNTATVDNVFKTLLVCLTDCTLFLILHFLL